MSAESLCDHDWELVGFKRMYISAPVVSADSPVFECQICKKTRSTIFPNINFENLYEISMYLTNIRLFPSEPKATI